MRHERKGISVWVTSDNDVLDEYRTEMEDEHTVRCYIPSVAGEHFEVCWEDHSNIPASLVACYMDGRPMGGIPSRPHSGGCNDGVRVSETTVKPFCFSSVITTDDEDVADPDGTDLDLGCIQVEFHRIDTQLVKDTWTRKRGQVQGVGPVHERSKKLGAHCVSLGEEHRAINKGSFVAPTLLGGGPFAVFRFIHRPRELLLARGIIPSQPLAEDPSQKIDIKPDTRPATRLALKEEPTDIKPNASSSSAPRGRRTRSSIAATPQPHQLTARKRRSRKRKVKREPLEATISMGPIASTSGHSMGVDVKIKAED